MAPAARRRRPGRRRAAGLARPGAPVAGLAGIVFGLSETETHGGLTAPIAYGPILAGIVLVALFVRHAARAERPLIDVRLFRSMPFSAAAAATFLLGAALFGAMIILPLYDKIDRAETAPRPVC